MTGPVVLGIRAVLLVSVAGVAAVAPSSGNGAGQPHLVPGVLFPDCHLCPAPLPEPRQSGKFVGVPQNYTPGTRYEMALETTPHRGQTSRFSLAVTSGELEASDPGTRTLRFYDLPNSSGLPGVRNYAMLTYAQPARGPSATWRFAWTAPPAGSGTVTFAFYTMSGLEDGALQKDAWQLQQVSIPEASASPSTTSAPRLEPVFPPPPTVTPRPSPGFETVAALPALALAAAVLRRRG